jgi:glycine cleavage system pyridoxal-binding protein P
MAQDCVAPAAPEITEGQSATLEQMLAAQKSVMEFQAANLAYMSCLEPQLTAAEAAAKAATDATREQAVKDYQVIQDTYNAAVSKQEEVAGKFNTEIRDYKAANPGRSKSPSPGRRNIPCRAAIAHSTVTDLAKLRGLSTSVPFCRAT